jgi:hypothetical protein
MEGSLTVIPINPIVFQMLGAVEGIDILAWLV